jgi:hypothetical protein
MQFALGKINGGALVGVAHKNAIQRRQQFVARRKEAETP